MTILPKKKGEKDGGDSHVQQGADRHSHERSSRRSGSPQRWLPQSNQSHDTNHSKRRHRSSPHRTFRKHRQTCTGNQSHSLQRVSLASNTPPRASCSPQGSQSLDDQNQLETGYNSSDEYYPSKHPENLEQFEMWFAEAMKKRGFLIKKMDEDGACLFRAVADQIYGDQEMHSVVRKCCIDYMAKNADFFKQYVTEDFNMYLMRKGHENAHGNHIEMQAIAELYNRPVEVYQYSLEPTNIFHGTYKTDSVPIRISYHGNVHYNSLVDPYKATVGVGLGLPGHQPGLAEKNLMKDATQVSEKVHIEQQMLEDKLRETDWEVTQESIEEQVARESYLQWLRDNEKRAKRHTSPRSASATCSSAAVYDTAQQNWWEAAMSPEPRTSRSPRQRSNNNSTQNSPDRPDFLTDDHLQPSGGSLSPNQPSTSNNTNSNNIRCATPEGAVGGGGANLFRETTSLMDQLPPQIFGICNEWEEDDIIAQVMAQSQEEYLESLKKKATSSSPAKNSSAKSSDKRDRC